MNNQDQLTEKIKENMIRLGKVQVTELVEMIPLSAKRFRYLIRKHKPKEIFNNHYSSKTPCYFITEYLKNGNVLYHANAAADKTPVETTLDDLYNHLKYQGLSECYF